MCIRRAVAGLCLGLVAVALASCEPLETPLASTPPPPGPTTSTEVAPTRPPEAIVDTALAAADPGRRYLPWAGTGDAVAPVAEAPGPAVAATLAPAVAVPAAGCPAGIARRQGDQVVVDGQPVFFFGLNAQHFLDKEYPEEKVEPLLAGLSERGVNTLRVWYFDYNDPERFQRLLDLGAKHGIRFVVTLGDNVNRGRDWFFGNNDEKKYRPHLTETVSRFKDRPEILMWEVINEPNCAGNYDQECLDVIREWLTMATGKVKQIDPCHIISTGMIGAGNYEEEVKNYKTIHRKGSVGIVSQHRRATDEGQAEVELAADIDRPIFYGEVYDKAFDEGCEPLDGGQALRKRATVIKDDLQGAIDAGVDGYLLWDLNAGRVKDRDFCSEFAYDLDDPLWPALREAGLPPPVPW
jgi:hypothetical protein